MKAIKGVHNMNSFNKIVTVTSFLVVMVSILFTACSTDDISQVSSSSSSTTLCSSKSECNKQAKKYSNEVEKAKERLKTAEYDLEAMQNMLKRTCAFMDKARIADEDKNCEKAGY